MLHVGEGTLDVEVYGLYSVNGLRVDRDVGEERELVHLILALHFLRRCLDTGTIHPSYKQLGSKEQQKK